MTPQEALDRLLMFAIAALLFQLWLRDWLEQFRTPWKHTTTMIWLACMLLPIGLLLLGEDLLLFLYQRSNNLPANL